MTINELAALAGLTANDQIPVWDAEAAANGRTKKISAQMFAGTIGPLANLNLKTYTSVTQLGLTSGSATILSAFNALPDNSALYADNVDFATGETPTMGLVEIVKRQFSRIYIAFYGKNAQSNDYRMFEGATDYNNQDANAPTGQWVVQWGAQAISNLTYTLSEDQSFEDVSVTVNGDSILRTVHLQFSAKVKTAIAANSLHSFASMNNSGVVPSDWFFGSGVAVNNGAYSQCLVVKNNTNGVVAFGASQSTIPVGALLYGSIIWQY